ncbi:MAG: hypothetical protein COB12_08680 [Flavobacterium sp.]|nr:MAG: hypothetical protein COB12_08680 [Flavobacterium sp.]
MEYFYKYLLNIIPIFSLEVISVIVGIYYLKKNQSASKIETYFLYYLGLTVAVEIIALYTPIAYFSNYEYFGFTKGKRYERNSWLYNIYVIISFAFYIYFFSTLLTNGIKQKTLKTINIVFVLATVLNLMLSDVFYKGDSIFTIILGSFILLFSVILFYFQLLESDKIISLKKILPVYISIGVLIFYLCLTPIAIFSQYFNPKNELFINVKAIVMPLANIIMYGAFIIGFIACAKSNPNKDELLN